MKTLTCIILSLSLCLSVFSQECSCLEQFEWMVKTYSENDAGFQFAIDEKGRQAYEKHNETFRKHTASIESMIDCAPVLYEWLSFFRSGHHGIEFNGSSSDNQSQLSDKEIIKKYADTEKVAIDEASFEEYLSTLEQPSFAGVWKYGNYTIGVMEDKDNAERDYVGFIIDADGVYWQPQQVKMEWVADNEDGTYMINYYLRNHSKESYKAELVGPNHLKTSDFFWERLLPEYPDDPKVAQYLRAQTAEEAYVEAISEDATLVRIPSFERSNKPHIDSVLAANHEFIISHPIMLIDVRGNGGGSDDSYYELLPYLYTNPIRTIGVEFLSTPLNNRRMEEFLESGDLDEETIAFLNQTLTKLKANIGEFVMLGDHPISTDTLSEILPMPQKVGILMNEECGSTTEQFLLAAKQSQKVKLFGVSTAGVLDISNQYFEPFPCGEMYLIYALSRSMRLPDYPIDDIGIQPDFLMNRFIKDEDWIRTALETLR